MQDYRENVKINAQFLLSVFCILFPQTTNQQTKMKKLLPILFLSIASFLSAQDFSMDLVKNMKPRNIGPGGMSGRVTAIDVVESNPDIMYVGTASGGIWKSTSGGIKWEPIFEKELTASIELWQFNNPIQVYFGQELVKETQEIV